MDNMNQRGFAFLPFLLANWQLLALGIVVLSAFLYYKHCEFIKNEHSALVNNLKVAAIENDKKVKAAIEQSRKEKERADESHKRTVARLNRDVKRLRDNPPSSFLPAPAAGSASPDRACISRSESDRAFRDFREGVLGLLAEGDQGIAGLDTAKEWARDR